MIDKTVRVEATINAEPSAIWSVLTTPAHISQYLFNTKVSTEWKVGSSIEFDGAFNGVTYHDKGTIIQIDENCILEYTYLSSMSGLDDVPENYALITFRISEEGSHTVLEVTQKGFASEEAITHSSQMWKMVVGQIKEIAESL